MFLIEIIRPANMINSLKENGNTSSTLIGFANSIHRMESRSRSHNGSVHSDGPVLANTQCPPQSWPQLRLPASLMPLGHGLSIGSCKTLLTFVRSPRTESDSTKRQAHQEYPSG